MRNARLLALAVVLWLPTLVGFAGRLAAATIIVTSAQDVIANNGLCSLREAVIAANTNAPSGAAPGECVSGSSGVPDTINLPAGTLTLTLGGSESTFATNAAVGDLDITQSVTIQGQGIATTTVTASGLGARVFHILSTTATVTFADLRITGGVSTGDGGGIFFDDGVSMNITRVSLTGNQAVEGGGVWATSTADVAIADCAISGNIASGGGGGGVNWSGCLGCDNILSVTNSVIEGNQSIGFFPGGGGVRADGGVFTLTNTTIADNLAQDSGGGLWMSQATFSASGSTISGNHTDSTGGGIYFDFPSTSTMNNCTVSGNSAKKEGGGIAILSNDTVTLKHCTLASNSAADGSAIGDGDNITVANTIIAGTCAGDAVTSLGGNIESPGDNCGLNQTADQVAVSGAQLALASLAGNGGPTLTHLPGPASAAVNTARALHCLPTDQRGVPRPIGSGCDKGAVEVDPNAIFHDGFESGNTGAWGGAVP
jgi:CSLREA domain-containing protein